MKRHWDGNVPGWLNPYWTALTFVDPASIVLLMVNVPLGLVLYLCVILSGVVINYVFYSCHNGFRRCLNFNMICRLLFLIFVLSTMGTIFKEVKRVKNGNGLK